MQIRTFWKAREQTRKTMLFFAHQPQYSVIFVGRKLGRFGVPGFCVVCLLCLSTRPWGGPPRSGASQGLGIGNIMLVMQGKPNFQRITGATCAPPRPHRPPPGLILIHPVDAGTNRVAIGNNSYPSPKVFDQYRSPFQPASISSRVPPRPAKKIVSKMVIPRGCIHFFEFSRSQGVVIY